jgi:hypothetical protein
MNDDFDALLDRLRDLPNDAPRIDVTSRVLETLARKPDWPSTRSAASYRAEFAVLGALATVAASLLVMVWPSVAWSEDPLVTVVRQLVVTFR